MIIFGILLFFILISAGLAAFLVKNDHGEKEPIGALWLAFGFGFGGAIAAAILENLFIAPDKLVATAPIATIFGASITVGLIEESCKFLPLSFFLFPKRYFNEHTDGIIYFALAGLGFGLPENILYTLQYGAQTGISRVFLTPFFHAAITGMVGYFLIKAKLAGKSRWRVIPALLSAMVLHGIYDFGLISGNVTLTIISIFITISLSLALFLLYFKATELDQKIGMSVVGHNSFCRSCGYPNPKHRLYCAHCGQRA